MVSFSFYFNPLKILILTGKEGKSQEKIYNMLTYNAL